MRGRARKLGAVAVALILVVLPATASAKKGHKKAPKLGPVITATATGNTVSSSGAESTATASCPGGKQAVGGGFSVPLTAASKLFVTSSFRTAAGDGWTVIARQEEGTGAATAIAYCRKAKPAIIDAAHSNVVPSGGGQVGTDSVACPAGAFLVSGGFQIEGGAAPGSFAFPVSSLAIETSAVWSVQAVNNQAGAHNFLTHAYCMPRVAPPRFLDASREQKLSTGSVGSLSSPACPKAKKPRKGKKKPAKLLSAGGFAGQASQPIEIFSDTGIDSGTWSISGINFDGPSAPVHLTSQAICL